MSTETKKIGTLMSIYRRDDPAALDRALRSISEQNFKQPVESRIYLAIDGPVTAQLDQIIQRWEPKIYKLCRLPENVGLAAALNHLIKLLEDESLVFRMDADDYSLPERYQTQIDHLEQHPEVDILGCDILEKDLETGAQRRVSFGGRPGNVLQEICKRVPVAHPTVCFRRHVLERIKGYPVNRGNEDIAMWFRCAQEGFNFDNLNEILLEFTISRDFWRRRGFSKALIEFKCYAVGIWSLHGISWRYIFPIMRLAMRLAPAFISKRMYASTVRIQHPAIINPR